MKSVLASWYGRFRIELLLTLATEATNPQHPVRKWAVERYKRTVDLGVNFLREACAMGEVAD